MVQQVSDFEYQGLNLNVIANTIYGKGHRCRTTKGSNTEGHCFNDATLPLPWY